VKQLRPNSRDEIGVRVIRDLVRGRDEQTGSTLSVLRCPDSAVSPRTSRSAGVRSGGAFCGYQQHACPAVEDEVLAEVAAVLIILEGA